MQTSRKRTFNQREQIFRVSISPKKSSSRGRSSSKNRKPHIRSYSREELDQLYEQKFLEVKQKYQKDLLKKSNTQLATKIFQELKRCEKCFDFRNQSSMQLCSYCEDGYHCFCVDPQGRAKKRDEFVCPYCEKQLDNEEAIPTKLKGINKTVKKVQKVK